MLYNRCQKAYNRNGFGGKRRARFFDRRQADRQKPGPERGTGPIAAARLGLSHPVFDAASSTFVRDNIDDYHKIADMISPEVYGYITENNLYRK